MTVKKTIAFNFSQKECNLIDDFRCFLDDLDETEFEAILEVTKGQNFIDGVITLWNLALEDNTYSINEDEDDEELNC